MQLKRWESPRREGRNDKGRGGSARKRQLKKQRQMLRQKLKQADKAPKGGREKIFPLFLVLSYPTNCAILQVM
ncbi:hypothetical protein [Anabaena sp. CS-542/02]|jgi:hypothetical protein|uniref:hypothetical protein n=1 Tax=Anabaena sp. CS-542/02 TaxID=3021719 RepID=UPI00232C12C8|nr:hypothetical protein [Anabaena sp. CS-542/02]MDB9447537.1 hypothetical protein [Anabaena sp. CS-542/02]